MAHGFRIRNKATGSKQIDQDFYNPALISKQTITSSSSQAPGTGGSSITSLASVTINHPVLPLVAIRSSAVTAPAGVQRSGDNWTFSFYVSGLSQTITVYVFGQPPALGPGWGHRIKKNGVVMWDSRHRYVRRVARSGTGSGSEPSGKTYAAICGNTGMYTLQDVADFGTFWRVTQIWRTYGVVFGSGGWSYGQLPLRGYLQETNINPGGSYLYDSPPGPISIIDVSGY